MKLYWLTKDINPNCLTPFKGDPTPEEEAFNEVIASVRILVECVIKRIKSFGVLGRFHSMICLNTKLHSMLLVISLIFL